jgi:hypothetical protein
VAPVAVATPSSPEQPVPVTLTALVLVGVLLLVMAYSAWLARRRRAPEPPRQLSLDERQLMLTRVREWMEPARIAQSTSGQVR